MSGTAGEIVWLDVPAAETGQRHPIDTGRKEDGVCGDRCVGLDHRRA